MIFTRLFGFHYNIQNCCLSYPAIVFKINVCPLSETGSHQDDEYAWAGVQDPKIMITTSHNPSSRLKQFAKVNRKHHITLPCAICQVHVRGGKQSDGKYTSVVSQIRERSQVKKPEKAGFLTQQNEW